MATLAFQLALVFIGSTRDADPFTVRVALKPGTHYAGQAIEAIVSTVAGREAPRIVAPATSDARIIARQQDVRPLTASGIGEVVAATNLFRAHYWIVPRRAGTLRVPPFRARLGERAGASAPLTIEVRDVPAAGRTAAFLGGVGALKVDAEAKPTTIRLGQEVEYYLRLDGPAALGSIERPTPRFRGVRVSPEPDQLVTSPPSRLWVWRLRPTRAGELVVPPVPVAHFDPEAKVYLTKLAPSVRVRVMDVPRLDPSAIDYADPAETPEMWRPMFAGGLGLSIALIGLIVARRRFRRPSPRRLARRLLAKLGGSQRDVDSTARQINLMVAEFLHHVADRPTGALTPEEARLGIEAAGLEPALATRVGALITACDRARFAGKHETIEDLTREAREVFEMLSRRGAAD